jgi:hypothetical protein
MLCLFFFLFVTITITIIILGVLEFELRASCLLYCLSHFATLLCVVLFLRWGLTNYLPRLVQTSTLLICATSVARMTGVRHWHLALIF